MTSGPPRRFARAALVYLGLSGVWFYGVLDQGVVEGSAPLTLSAFGFVVLAHVAFGFAVREWVALLLPIAVVPLVIPAGLPASEFSEPLPLSITQVFLVQIEIPLIALGIGLRSLAERSIRPGSAGR